MTAPATNTAAADWLLEQFDAARRGPGELSSRHYLNQADPRPIPGGQSRLARPGPGVVDVPPAYAVWDRDESWGFA